MCPSKKLIMGWVSSLNQYLQLQKQAKCLCDCQVIIKNQYFEALLSAGWVPANIAGKDHDRR